MFANSLTLLKGSILQRFALTLNKKTLSGLVGQKFSREWFVVFNYEMYFL